MPPWVDPVPALKRRLAEQILEHMGEFSQQFAAYRVHLPRSRVSDLRRGHLERISLERMIRSLSCSGYDIEIIVTKKARRVGAGRADRPHDALGFAVSLQEMAACDARSLSR